MFSPKAVLCGILYVLVASMAGCGALSRETSSSPSSSASSIIREMATAAKVATGDRAEVSVRPERGTETQRHSQNAANRIFITIPERSGEPLSMLSTLESRLDAVARRHHLDHVQRNTLPGLIQFDYLRAGQKVLTVEIIAPIARPDFSGESMGRPRLAIIIDDLGNERPAAEAVLSIPVPLTLAILPQLPYSELVAEEAHGRGFEVLLHLPMEPQNGESAGAVELRPGMHPADVERALSEMLKTVPNATGVNNHEGSRGTADPELMSELMPLLAERHLFFIDSRTTAATLAYDAAVRAGVPAASRNVFLDDVEETSAIRAQLNLAVTTARRNGAAIAIGHPHPQTLAVLAGELPKLSREGVTLVFASELCAVGGRGITASGNSAAQVSRAFPPPSWPPAAQSRAPR